MPNYSKEYTVLIADDDESSLVILSGILSPRYHILTASGGAQALQAAREHSPDLILLDVVMPKMDGFEVLRMLQESDATNKIPVIFITGLSDPDSEEKGLSLGAVDYIIKPFNQAVVKARVNTQIKLLGHMRVIEQIGLIDPLTNIANRRGFEERFGEEWFRARREGLPLSLLMLDLDWFKEYNDAFGHPQGDLALAAVAQTLSEELKRSSDFAARWGGEEFIALLPNLDQKGAWEVANRLRTKVAALAIPGDNGIETSITLSIGVHTVVPTTDISIGDSIKKADKALYKAKETGRNKVAVSE
ncbi:MAG: diguanylate cyclase [Firmicutes bacterium]|nr:diguanylate cyclase [Bacillota bacterium]